MTTVVAAVIERDGKILVCQRSAHGPHPLKWEFPGGKVEAGETLEEALTRELREELGIQAEIGPELERYEYAYPGGSPIKLVFHTVSRFAEPIENLAFASIVWIVPTSLRDFDFLDGDLQLVETIIGKERVES